MKSTIQARANREPGRALGRPPSLSRAEIVQVALALVRRKGSESLTMRALAEELGCGPMSLYSHVRDKAELLDAVGALALDELDIEVRDGAPWTEQLESWMHSLALCLFEYPQIAELIASQQNDSPALLRAIREPIRLLLDVGFDRPAAVSAAQGMLWVALGFLFIGSLPLRYPRGDSPADQLAAALARVPEAERADAESILPHLVTDKEHARLLYTAVARRLIHGLADELQGGAPSNTRTP
jgi:AcrR family transcriptional regulator